MKQYLAFIPERRGSKSIQKKNMALLAGKPLIQYTLDIVNALGKRAYPLVSTNDEGINAYCANQGLDLSIIVIN